jgi:hypothetical protein
VIVRARHAAPPRPLEQPTDDGVVLQRDRQPVRIHLGEHGFGVEWFEHRGVHDRGFDVMRRQVFGGQQCPHRHQPARHLYHVRAGAQHFALPNSKL